MPTKKVIRVTRDKFADGYTLGKMVCDGEMIGFTCEDKDRKLEEGGEKVYGQSAIPRGTYDLTISMSKRFGKVLPEIRNVPGFTGVRIHGGNTSADSLGCILLGTIRAALGVRNCAPAVARLIEIIKSSENQTATIIIE